MIHLPDPTRISAYIQQLNLLVRTTSVEEADAALTELCDTLYDTDDAEAVPSAIAAAQTLRDHGEIDDSEAAYLLYEFYGAVSEDIEEGDDEIERLRQALSDFVAEVSPDVIFSEPEPPELTAIHEAWERRRIELQAAFYTERGEHELAALLTTAPNEFETLTDDGRETLVEHKYPVLELATAPDAKKVARITEAITALVAAETTRESIMLWKRLFEVAALEDAISGVSAVQTAATLGLLTKPEAAALLDLYVETLAEAESGVDREITRLRAAKRRIERLHGIPDDDSFPEGQAPASWTALDAREQRRWDELYAKHYSRHEEYELAHLVSTDRSHYAALVDAGGTSLMIRELPPWAAPPRA
jgi:hypothetical protein